MVALDRGQEKLELPRKKRAEIWSRGREMLTVSGSRHVCERNKVRCDGKKKLENELPPSHPQPAKLVGRGEMSGLPVAVPELARLDSDWDKRGVRRF